MSRKTTLCTGQLSFDDLTEILAVARAPEPEAPAHTSRPCWNCTAGLIWLGALARMAKCPICDGSGILAESALDALWWTTVRPEPRPRPQPRPCTYPACGELAPPGRKRCDAHKPASAGTRQRRPSARDRRPASLPGVIQPPSREYSEIIPELPGFYVYRLWTADGTCLYVGMVGKNGPRRVDQRFGEHELDHKTWWLQVARAEVRSFAIREGAEAEERHQIATLMPAWNKQGTGTQVYRVPSAVA